MTSELAELLETGRSSQVEEFSVQHRGECVRSNHEVKYLGVVVDEDLK